MKKASIYPILILCVLLGPSLMASELTLGEVQPVYEDLDTLFTAMDENEDEGELKKLAVQAFKSINAVKPNVLAEVKSKGFPVAPQNHITIVALSVNNVRFIFYKSKEAFKAGDQPFLYVHLLMVVEDGDVIEALMAAIEPNKKQNKKQNKPPTTGKVAKTTTKFRPSFPVMLLGTTLKSIFSNIEN